MYLVSVKIILKPKKAAMKDTSHYFPRSVSHAAIEPFDDAVEAWFWFIQAQQARTDGARFTSGLGLVTRPCEPADILNVLNRLYRGRRLMMDHLLVLRHYGRRQMAPDPTRAKEIRAHDLWVEAFARIEPVLIDKGIVQARDFFTMHITPHAMASRRIPLSSSSSLTF